MKEMITKFISFFKKYPTEIIVLSISFIIFLTNTLYVSYPDEFINLLAGKAINAGKIPYREFFDHHLPFAWYLASVFLWFSGNSYVVFRIIWALFNFACLFSVFHYLSKTNKELAKYYLIYIGIFPFVTVYYWLHLYLADSLAFLSFSIILWLLIGETYKKNSSSKTLLTLSLLNFIFVFSSMSFIYIAAILYLWMLYLLNKNKIDIKKSLILILVSILPYVLYACYLFLTNSYKEFYISNIVYNTKLYISIPNYTRGRMFNPIKFALTLIFNFYQNYLVLISHIKDFNLFLPVDLTLGLGSLLLLVFLFFESKIIFFFVFLIMSFSAPRSEVTSIGETNYQIGIFIAFGLIAAIWTFWRSEHLKVSHDLLNSLKNFAVGLLIVYFSFSVLFLVKNTYDKFFKRYTQVMPGIYDLAPAGNFIDDILEKDDYFWIGPYEPHESFFVKKAHLAGKYPSLLPQFREDDYFKNGFTEQFKDNPPKLIIFKHDASIFMTPAMEFGKFFIDWMKDKYTSIENIKGIEVVNNPSNFTLRTDLYLRNENIKELLSILKQKGYIK